MQYDLKKLEKKYKDKSIKECVELAKSLNEEMLNRGEQLVGLLWYLEKTKRFHEWNGYDKISFKVFVWEICHISYNRYRELAYAYNWYPAESREYGPQTIQTIKNKVGVVKIPKVLGEIKTKTAKVQDPLKRRTAINEVIEKYAPPKPKKVKAGADTKAYWKSKYEKLLADYNALKGAYDELQAQVERQKPAVRAFMKIQDISRQPQAVAQ